MSVRDYRKEYKGKCLLCKRFDLNNSHQNGFACDRRGIRVKCDSNECGYSVLTSERERSNKDIDRAYDQWNKYYGSRWPSIWYIISALSKIFDIDFNYDNYCNNLRNKLLESESGTYCVKYYDIYGLECAKKILEKYYKNEEDRNLLLQYINDEIMPVLNSLLNSLENGDFNSSVSGFNMLVSKFSKYFEMIPDNSVIDTESEYNGPANLEAYPLYQRICKEQPEKVRIKATNNRDVN